MNAATEFRGLDDWESVCRFLPLGWERAARQQGALRRKRGIRDSATLLRVLLVHLADGCSLQETARAGGSWPVPNLVRRRIQAPAARPAIPQLGFSRRGNELRLTELRRILGL